MVNMKCDTNCDSLMGHWVEQTVTMVGPSLCLGSASHLRVHQAVTCIRCRPGSRAEQ